MKGKGKEDDVKLFDKRRLGGGGRLLISYQGISR